MMSGCATSRGRISLKKTPIQKIMASNNKSVYIDSVSDKRVFELKPSQPNIPSLKNGGIHNSKIKSHAIARKRNGFGKAMGDILLKDGQTVDSVIKSNTEEALLEKGYKIIHDKNNITKQTIILDININQFWTWINIGFWALRISTEVGTNIHVKQTNNNEQKIIHFTVSDTFQTGAGRNYIEVMQMALKKYRTELKANF